MPHMCRPNDVPMKHHHHTQTQRTRTPSVVMVCVSGHNDLHAAQVLQELAQARH
jgi:hypothetical protein